MPAKCFGILTPGCTQQRTSVPHCQLLHFSAAKIIIQMKHQEEKSDFAEKCDCACFKHHNDFLYCILTSNTFSAFSPCLKISVKDERS